MSDFYVFDSDNLKVSIEINPDYVDVEEPEDYEVDCECPLCLDDEIEDPDIEDYDLAWDRIVNSAYCQGLVNLYQETGIMWNELVSDSSCGRGNIVEKTQAIVDLAVGYGFETPGDFLNYILESEV